MRIKVRLPKIEPGEYDWPTGCPHADCHSQRLKRHGVKGERKPLRDPRCQEVRAYRYRCLRCGRTFRVYPRGVSEDQQSDRLKAISVLLYVLGLSYGAVEDFLDALGVTLAKTTVYHNVQEAGMASRQRQAEGIRHGQARPVIGSDGTYVKVKGQMVGVQVVVDDRDSDLLALEIIVSESAEEVERVVREVAQQVKAEVLVTDDLDSYKPVADALGLHHQICRVHVKRNVDDLAAELQAQLQAGEPIPEGVESSPERLVQDLEQLQGLVRDRPVAGAEQLEGMYACYCHVPLPAQGERHNVWCRMRMLITRLWDRWPRLTLDQRRADLDGTNNSAERMIGWWCKERYRAMRGYKRTESIKNVVTLTARMGARSGTYDMTELYA
jgi:transposase-like protein